MLWFLLGQADGKVRKTLKRLGWKASVIEIGDRVKLTAHCLRGLVGHRLKRSQVKWRKRRGTVVRIAKTADQITIKWDDRHSLDYWPQHALEKA